MGALGGAILRAQSTTTADADYVVEVKVRDVDTNKNDYTVHVAGTLAPCGGRDLAAGGRTERVDGARPASRFPMDNVEAWYNSPEYDKIKPVRHTMATTRSSLVKAGRVRSNGGCGRMRGCLGPSG
jgi:uncharacterized protein (DUF1330 family)